MVTGMWSNAIVLQQGNQPTGIKLGHHFTLVGYLMNYPENTWLLLHVEATTSLPDADVIN